MLINWVILLTIIIFIVIAARNGKKALVIVLSSIFLIVLFIGYSLIKQGVLLQNMQYLFVNYEDGGKVCKTGAECSSGFCILSNEIDYHTIPKTKDGEIDIDAIPTTIGICSDRNYSSCNTPVGIDKKGLLRLRAPC